MSDLDRLCKVRRLARQSPEPGERRAGEAKLTELLAKHGITEHDLDRHEGPVFRRHRPPEPQPFAGAVQFPGGVVIEIVPGSPFGQVFGFGFGFNVTFPDSSTQTP
jgi:hypothetical protein